MQRFVDSLVPALADASLPQNSHEFDAALKNTEHGAGKLSGIVMCYGNTEGYFCIRKAYQTLQERVAPDVFATKVARAIQIFSAPFPEGEHNLTYAHFLPHGIQQPTVDGVIAKIVDNGRIVHESETAKREIREKFGTAREISGTTYKLFLEHGDTDDFHGLSLRLCSAQQSSFGDRTAKTGFLIDNTNRTAIIINVQGRKVWHSKNPDENAKDAKKGREYARLTHQLGKDPRTFVIEQAKFFLAECGILNLKAIKPEHHVMNIAGHPNFSARYEAAIRAAGLTRDDGIYLASEARE